MSTTHLIGRLLGYDDVSSIESIRPSFGSQWAHDGPAWVFFGCLGLCALAAVFYLRAQPGDRRRIRLVLAAGRAVLLCLLFLILADPILKIQFTHQPQPVDHFSDDERARFAQAVGLSNYLAGTADDAPHTQTADVSRADYVRALARTSHDNLFEALSEKFRLRAYLVNRADDVRSLDLHPAATGSRAMDFQAVFDSERTTNGEDARTRGPSYGEQRQGLFLDGRRLDTRHMADQLTADGQVTALGNAFQSLATRHADGHVSGLLVISDFGQNAGIAPLAAARRLGVPVFTLGVGATSAVDLSVDLLCPLTMKRADMSTVTVTLRHEGLDGYAVPVRVTARRTDAGDSYSTGEPLIVGERTVELQDSMLSLDFPFTPQDAGRFVFAAEVDPIEGEVVTENNRAEREVTVIDDFLRLLFVEYEPTWEWRFIKEVFHRDPLVGMRGFRTYLRSSDPVVRETNDLFLPSLTLPRSEFFVYDVLFLGDMPKTALNTRFCELVKEFVGDFGGGLVVIAGPQFGPGELAGTPLADMLPVVVDPDARLRQDREYRLKLTPLADQFDFMRLGQDDAENRTAWDNLGPLSWYWPVKRSAPLATTVLAEHPTDTCLDGQTPQPLIAVRKYGRGEVVYVGFNEMWRVRRKYGERYYRQFWGQLIHRLGLSHALGGQKRFVVRTDRQHYRPEDNVLLTVEAYDENFNPLAESAVPGNTLQGRLLRPGRDEPEEHAVEPLIVAQSRAGVFETKFPVVEDGEYQVQVADPISGDLSRVHFRVTAVSAERRSAVRNVAVERSLAAETNGRSYELDTVSQFLHDFHPPRRTEYTTEIIPVWSTWLYFIPVILLMLGEWFVRKLVHLT
jgi:hypothetical protein